MKLFTGTVKALHPVTRNRVQIELHETREIFELFIDQSWVVSSGDRVSLAGMQDETGKTVCYAYENHSKSVKGWNYKQSNMAGYFIIGLSLFFVCLGLTLFPPFLLAIIFTGAGLQSVWNTIKTNALYESARRVLESSNSSHEATRTV